MNQTDLCIVLLQPKKVKTQLTPSIKGAIAEWLWNFDSFLSVCTPFSPKQVIFFEDL